MTQARDLAASAHRSVAESDPRELLGHLLGDPALGGDTVDGICRDTVRAYQRGVHTAWFDHGMDYLERRLGSNARIAAFFGFKVPSAISKLRASKRFTGEQLTAILHSFPDFTLPSSDQEVLAGLAQAVDELAALPAALPEGHHPAPITPSQVALVLATSASVTWPDALEDRDPRPAREAAHAILREAPIKDSDPCHTWSPEQKVRLLIGLHQEYADPVTVAARIVFEEFDA